jgi:hypothetical protein
MIPRYFKSSVIKGLLFGFGTILIFGVYVYVRAVDAGSVTNPAFGPKDDNVVIQYALECQQFSAANTVNCPAGFTRTGGGGQCNDGNSDSADFFPNTTNGYTASCGGSSSEIALVICCRVAPI